MAVCNTSDQFADCDIIRNGDTVIIQLETKKQQAVVVRDGEVLQTMFGALPHSFLIGRPFGCKVLTMNARGYVHALRLTPELWTVNLLHRTQIIYAHDISLIVTMLELQPGKVVVESGTGSGSLSHALIRAVKPSGHLFTYEFHAERARTAREEFDSHGIGDHVTVTFNDVLKNGYYLENVADAVVLDLPMSEKAIGHAKKVLKRDRGRLCSFSPCIEQVQQTCATLHAQGFYDIQTFECLAHDLQPTTVYLSEPNFTCARRLITRLPGDAAGSSSDLSSSTAADTLPRGGEVVKSIGATSADNNVVSDGGADAPMNCEEAGTAAGSGETGCAVPGKRPHEGEDSSLPSKKQSTGQATSDVKDAGNRGQLGVGVTLGSQPTIGGEVVEMALESTMKDDPPCGTTSNSVQESSVEPSRKLDTTVTSDRNQTSKRKDNGTSAPGKLSSVDLSRLRLVENVRKQQQGRDGNSDKSGRGRGHGRGRGGSHHSNGGGLGGSADTPANGNNGGDVCASVSAYSEGVRQQSALLSAAIRTPMCEGRVPGHTGYLTFALIMKSTLDE